jgi:type VI secretion system protein ImpD
MASRDGTGTDSFSAGPAWSAPAAPAEAGLLDAILQAPSGTSRDEVAGLQAFLDEPAPLKAACFWAARAGGPVPRTVRELKSLIGRAIARLDDLLNRLVNAILHHPAFQKLEASWRGLYYLVEQVREGDHVKVRVLNVSWKELTRDLDRALEFDQSQLFRQVYSEEFGMAGGEPFGVLLGDYAVQVRPGPDQPAGGVAALSAISSVAAAAFAPFITAADPALLGLSNFTELERPLGLARAFEQPEYVKWRAFRQTEDARFVGLVLPRVLVRLPYVPDVSRVDGFCFQEDVTAPDRRGYLWGNAVYAFGAVLVRAFGDTGWLADIRGVRPGIQGGGLVTGLPAHSFATDRAGIAVKSSTDVLIPEGRERELAELGFVPLCHCPDTEWAMFGSNQSVQRPQAYDREAATANARLSAMLQYVLCVSRFAHYLKVLGRDKIGSLTGPAECESFLSRWLLQYTTTNDDEDADTKARFPLRESQVQVHELPGKPGAYRCVIHLRPHFQLDQMAGTIRLVTELAPARGP